MPPPACCWLPPADLQPLQALLVVGLDVGQPLGQSRLFHDCWFNEEKNDLAMAM
jgi:hypothetical protein